MAKLPGAETIQVELIHPESAEFVEALEALLGGPPDPVLQPALPYSVIVRNRDPRPIALLGIRFDMLGPLAKPCSVVHYADTLRHPEKAALRPGSSRFVCAEPLYTDLVLRGERTIDRRGPMNLQNLRTMLKVRASLDCVAFDDGEFAGRDSLDAFDRFEREREAEIALLEEIRRPAGGIEVVLRGALEIPPGGLRDRALLARRTLARRLHHALNEGGSAAAAELARSHRLRIGLWRGKPEDRQNRRGDS